MRKVSKIEPKIPVVTKRKRVAAYARVSMETDRLIHSLSAQVSYYNKLIQANPAWEFAGVYADRGISGTGMNNRQELKRLLEDCDKGLIDIVLTKSISRFARNTVDLLNTVRHLKDLGIEVRFEKEHINSLSEDGEIMLTLLASFAQEESRSISENIKWAKRKGFENGTYKTASTPYGYDWDGEKMVINSSQVEIVREIFLSALSGKGAYSIAKELNRRNIPTKHGVKWTSTTILGMLKNEKYTGDCLFQRTYTDSSFNRHYNHDNRTQFFIEEHHEGIISHEIFDKVQEEIRLRANKNSVVQSSTKYQARYAFSGKIFCGECGNTFKRRTHYYKGSTYIAWCCNTHLEDKENCSMLFVRDEDLKKAFSDMMKNLIVNYDKILIPYIEKLSLETKENSSVEELEKQIQTLQNSISLKNKKTETLKMLMAQGIIEQIAFIEKSNEISREIDNCRKEIERLNTLKHSLSNECEKYILANNLLKFCEKAYTALKISGSNFYCNDENSEQIDNYLEKIDVAFQHLDELFTQFAERIVVKSRHEFCFEFKCGLCLTQEI